MRRQVRNSVLVLLVLLSTLLPIPVTSHYHMMLKVILIDRERILLILQLL